MRVREACVAAGVSRQRPDRRGAAAAVADCYVGRQWARAAVFPSRHGWPCGCVACAWRGCHREGGGGGAEGRTVRYDGGSGLSLPPSLVGSSGLSLSLYFSLTLPLRLCLCFQRPRWHRGVARRGRGDDCSDCDTCSHGRDCDGATAASTAVPARPFVRIRSSSIDRSIIHVLAGGACKAGGRGTRAAAPPRAASPAAAIPAVVAAAR